MLRKQPAIFSRTRRRVTPTSSADRHDGVGILYLALPVTYHCSASERRPKHTVGRAESNAPVGLSRPVAVKMQQYGITNIQ
ncbi:hypothetical protein BDZ89DRAFT_1063636 [Hymenopellis radicata]|nr:hypothetical protein BDZ89DRAFT_1063636 [Hymenopellis radicata]